MPSLRPLLILAVVFQAVSPARLLHSLPEDTYAFPKSRVSFLNGRPLLHATARRWFKEGLRGGELEFLDQPWDDSHLSTVLPPKEIDSGDAYDSISTSNLLSLPTLNYTLEYMKIGPKDTYLCLLPKSTNPVPQILEEDESDFEVTSSRSWSLLQPLSGSCLYHRQGWFTYSYCHNHEIRQFKEAAQTPNPTGGYRPPEEDPEWESYTLGKAPKPGLDLTTAEQNPLAANFELARSTGSRYLVQRWGDGTMCDKTGKSREVEVQFHCSMTMTDSILFVKETKTCSYVLVIHTPRLCGEPGFKTRRDQGEEGQIRCRELADSIPAAGSASVSSNLLDTDHPLKFPQRRPISPAAVKTKQKAEHIKGRDDVYSDILRKTLESILRGKDMKVFLEEVSGDKDTILFEIVEDGDSKEGHAGSVDKFGDVLRAAGYEIKDGKITLGGDKNTEKKEQAKRKQQKDTTSTRDEL